MAVSGKNQRIRDRIRRLMEEADAIEKSNPEPPKTPTQAEIDDSVAFKRLVATYTYEQHAVCDSDKVKKYIAKSTPNTDEAIPLQSLINLAILCQIPSQAPKVFELSSLVKESFSVFIKLAKIHKDPNHVSRTLQIKEGELSDKRIQGIVAMVIALKGMATHSAAVAEVFSETYLQFAMFINERFERVRTVRYHLFGLFAAISSRQTSMEMFHICHTPRQIMKQGLVSDRMSVYQLSYVNKSLVLQETWAVSLSVLWALSNFINMPEMLEELMEAGLLDRIKSLTTGERLDAEMTHEVKTLHVITLQNLALKDAAEIGITVEEALQGRTQSSSPSPSPSSPSSSSSSSNCCSNCKMPRTNEQKLLKCGACKQVQYCGKECQIAHWKNGHKSECKTLAASS